MGNILSRSCFSILSFIPSKYLPPGVHRLTQIDRTRKTILNTDISRTRDRRSWLFVNETCVEARRKNARWTPQNRRFWNLTFTTVITADSNRDFRLLITRYHLLTSLCLSIRSRWFDQGKDMENNVNNTLSAYIRFPYLYPLVKPYVRVLGSIMFLIPANSKSLI